MNKNLYKLENIKRIERIDETFIVYYDGWIEQSIDYVLPVYTGSENLNISRTLRHIAKGQTKVRKQDEKQVSKEAAIKIVDLLKERDMIAFMVFTRFLDVDETIPDKRFWKIDTKKEK